jgi:hypothetical protein
MHTKYTKWTNVSWNGTQKKMKMLQLEIVKKKLKFNHPLHKLKSKMTLLRMSKCKSFCNQTNITCFLTLSWRIDSNSEKLHIIIKHLARIWDQILPIKYCVQFMNSLNVSWLAYYKQALALYNALTHGQNITKSKWPPQIYI